MRIDHLAIWVKDLEAMKTFYERFFGATAGELYHNPRKQFYSYFLSFGEGCRLELMHRTDIPDSHFPAGFEQTGITHFAISLGSKDAVDRLTEEIRTAGYTVAGEPRTTGDGYYESVVLDPEGNRVEIVA